MFATLVYGTCRASSDSGCAPPVQIQIGPLCDQLDAVTRNPIWKTRRIRGAPVGTIDGAPVLLTRRAQVKVYRGVGSDEGIERRVLLALRSLNHLPPRIGAVGPIPPPAPGVLEGTAPCPGQCMDLTAATWSTRPSACQGWRSRDPRSISPRRYFTVIG